MTDATTLPIPTPGRVVLYTLSEDDAARINKRRDDAIARAHEHKANPEVTGFQVHVGNRVDAGQQFPAMIVRAWGTTPESAANIHVLLDGNDTFWATSVTAGDGPRRFIWPNVLPKPTAADELRAADLEKAWRKAIADQVRRNCTPDSEAYDRGGDIMIRAVADWIENPPAWSAFEAPRA